ncbi:methyl-accepting chemotaxis protein [Selenomonas sp. ND2010]|uniref:methyl-accepting chemotaxis protein n=1 Tax=Selenomonas sp. ND2010 TaxID=1410618 RepID=UPI00051C2D22|nr:methyl-accepting chemotaxis protein [Selenomonas sp. ND2010]
MGIRQKFFTLAGVAGVIMAIVSGVGYYLASSHLRNSVEREITFTMQGSANKLDGWLLAKKQVAVSAADLMAKQDDGTKSPEQLRSLLAVAGEDVNAVSDLVMGNSDGTIVGYRAGNLAPKLNPRTMRFYNLPKASGQVEFMDTYVDRITGKLVVSIAAPYHDAAGAYRGAVCEDIFLDILSEEVKELKFQGEGTGYIFDNAGNIIATEDQDALNKNVADLPEFQQEYERMTQQETGFTTVEKNGEDMVLAYAKIPSTNWMVGILVPEAVIYSQLTTLKWTYGILTLVGILLIVFACLQFATGITRRILELKEHAAELAEGNLSGKDLMNLEADELGDLGRGFNVMKAHIKKLITQMSATSEQVAASSEELTASAQQSADASTNVAQTVAEVAAGVSEQTGHVDKAAKNVQEVVAQLSGVVEQITEITEMTVAAAKAASNGQVLMEQAINRMEKIEASVGDSAGVVAKLGKHSQEIGAIIDTISGIAEQTNLLALNAAIEAARAGEQGRGFSVVADEVRKLAEQSQAATEEIRQRIGAVQSGTGDAVSSMQAGTDEVQDGAKAIRAVGEEFRSIMQRVTAIKERMAKIDAAVQVVSAGGSQIENAVNSIDTVSRKTAEQTESISAATEEQSASTQEIAAASQSLAKMASELQDMAAKFRV